MKTLCIVLFSIGFVACENRISTQRVFPERNKKAAQEFIVKQMETIKITSRNEDEDFDDFLCQAKINALNIYGVDTIGVYENDFSSGQHFFPYALCSLEDRQRIDERINSIH